MKENELIFFKEEIHQAEKNFLANHGNYRQYSVLLTIISVLGTILIAQVLNFWVRIAGIILIIFGRILKKKIGKSFLEWLGNYRYYTFLKIELIEYMAKIDHYYKLSEDEMDKVVKSQIDFIKNDFIDFKNTLKLNVKEIEKEMSKIKEKIGKIKQKLLNNIDTVKKQNHDDYYLEKFEYYINSRYLDQLFWFFKRLNPIKEELKPIDIKKSEFLNYKKCEFLSDTFKYLAFPLVIFSYFPLLETLLSQYAQLFLNIIVLLATISSIISMVFDEFEKTRKNKENTVHYILTIKAMIRLYDFYEPIFDELIAKQDYKNLTIKERGFVNNCETILKAESVKWSEIQHAKED
ncbi:MAG: hypothetical protein ACTSRZ_16150 [Promethearchaeota archaeon]